MIVRCNTCDWYDKAFPSDAHAAAERHWRRHYGAQGSFTSDMLADLFTLREEVNT